MIIRIIHFLRRSVLPAVTLSLLVQTPAGAQQEAPQDASTVEPRLRGQRPADRSSYGSEGVWEFGGSATFLYSTPVVDGVTGSAVTYVSAAPYVGWFVMEGLALGAYPAGVALVRGGGTTVTELRFFAAPSFTLRGRLLVYPFLEGLAGYTAAITNSSGRNTTRSGFTWGGRAGIKIPLTERGLLVLGAQYLAVTLNPSGASRRNGSDEVSAAAGFTVWL